MTSQKTKHSETFLWGHQISQTKNNQIRTFFLRQEESLCPVIFPHRFPLISRCILAVLNYIMSDTARIPWQDGCDYGTFCRSLSFSWHEENKVKTLLVCYCILLTMCVCVCVCVWIGCVCNMCTHNISWLTLILLTWTIWRAPTNASKWRMGYNSAFKGLINLLKPTGHVMHQQFKLLKTKRDLLYIRNQFVPHSKHFPPRL